MCREGCEEEWMDGRIQQKLTVEELQTQALRIPMHECSSMPLMSNTNQDIYQFCNQNGDSQGTCAHVEDKM